MVLLTLLPRTAAAQIHLTQVISGLDTPVFVTSWPDNPNALVVVERGSQKISTFTLPLGGGIPVQALMLDLSGVAYDPLPSDFIGVTGFAFHPQFLENRHKRFIYVRYNLNTPNAPTTVIERYRIPPGTVAADPTSKTLLYSYPTIDTAHGAGQIHFDTVGGDSSTHLLYFALGDDKVPSSTCAEREEAQDDTKDVGKLWVINVDDPVPPVPTMMAKGLRNPFGFSVDRGDSSGNGKGDIWIGNTGPDCTGDIFVYPYGASGVRNYAWPWHVGDCSLKDGKPAAWRDTDCPEPANPPAFTLPDRVVSKYLTSQAWDAHIGGYVYRSTKVTELANPPQYVYCLYGTTGAPQVRSINAASPTSGSTADWSSQLGVNNWGSGELHGMGQDSDGELYLIRVSGTSTTNGTIYRIDG